VLGSSNKSADCLNLELFDKT